jgi:hypothetical protein
MLTCSHFCQNDILQLDTVLTLVLTDCFSDLNPFGPAMWYLRFLPMPPVQTMVTASATPVLSEQGLHCLLLS